MTIDKSLRVNKGLARARSVLTRAERLAKLKDADRWQEGQPVLGLPKVRVLKVSLKKKKKTKAEGEEGAAGGAAPAAAAGGAAKGAAGGKGAKK